MFECKKERNVFMKVLMKALLLNDFQRWCSEFLDQFSDLIIEQPLNNPVTISEIILTFFNG